MNRLVIVILVSFQDVPCKCYNNYYELLLVIIIILIMRNYKRNLARISRIFTTENNQELHSKKIYIIAII